MLVKKFFLNFVINKIKLQVLMLLAYVKNNSGKTNNCAFEIFFELNGVL